MGPEDLDALIGEIRQEAARRRAAPDFPLDEEAALSVEMDRTGPTGGGADLAAVTAALRRLAADREGKVGEVAGLAASAVAALSVRVTALERRSPPPPAAAAATGGPEPSPGDHWFDEVLLAVPAGGRTVVAGEGAAIWVERLTGVGRDAYGVDPARHPYADDGPVRAGELLEHLRTVSDGGLAAALMTGGLAGYDAERLADLAADLARVATSVVVAAEAPWAWRARVGDAAADTSARRPVGPEAWLAALSRAGFAATGRYGPDGRDYLLIADRRS
jgi:hypothetical protein